MLTRGEFVELEAAATRERVTLSEVLRRALRTYHATTKGEP